MPLSGHALSEERSLLLHRLVAERVRLEPSLLAIARAHLRRWRAERTLDLSYIEAWQALIDGPLPELLAVLTDESESSRALRQATPFAGLLRPRERWALLKQRAVP
jgi:hypothetical protein